MADLVGVQSTNPVGYAPPPPARSDPVGRAVERIEAALDEGFTDWDVGHGDLMDARAALNGLTPEQQSAVFSRLSDETLGHWLGEVNGVRGGLSANEKRDFHNHLAENLDATQLVRVMNNTRFVGDGEALGAAIGRAGGRTAVEFVDRMGESLNGRTRVGNFTTTEDVVARVIGNLDRPAEIDAALGALTPAQRESLATNSYRSGAESSEAYGQLYAAVARSRSVATRTEFFGYAAQSSQELRDAVKMPFSGQDFPALTPFYDAMTGLIRTDPRGMIDQMALRDVGMGHLTDYLEVAVIRGDTRLIGQLGAQVRRGEPIPGDTQTDSARFAHDYDRDGNNEDFRNAVRSGYFTGAAMAAASNVDADAEKQRALSVSLLTGGASTAAAAFPVGGQIAVGIGGIVTQQVAEAVGDKASGDRQDFFSAMHEAGMPRNARGELPTGEARAQFIAAVSEVMNGHAMDR
ncbi:hypothetical protein [Sphingomonas lenta]|uniref:Uncharacterized protein n=1 Tax=Sphingomonas lenta TaxID=1141887 RepID=A0A2A2SDC1_9SPHN|nr:hypothetical protein [Sphingomonas lenta]PAX07249.1 hypothetical protein CKY28_14575 [Sphingomonas lenta]